MVIGYWCIISIGEMSDKYGEMIHVIVAVSLRFSRGEMIRFIMVGSLGFSRGENLLFSWLLYDILQLKMC